MSKVFISGTGLYTPEDVISNEELVASYNGYVNHYNIENAGAIADGTLEALQESSVAFIEKASGIKQRYVMNKSGILDIHRMCPEFGSRSNDEMSLQCEIAVSAAKDAMTAAGKTAEDIDAVIVSCSSIQRAYPAVAVEVQSALGINGFAYDMNIACSSATFAVQSAADAIKNESARAVLVINPEITSGHLNYRDRDSHFIFGDVCTAMVVEGESTLTSANAFEIISSRLKTSFSNAIRNNFGFLNRCETSDDPDMDKLFVQQGRQVFKEVVPMVAAFITEHLTDEGFDSDNIKRMWLHQANISMNQLIGKKVLGRVATAEESPVILDRYANTASAGSIIAFHLCQDDLCSGDIGLISSFGAGYSVGSVLVKKN